MSQVPVYGADHSHEHILAECPRCRLPIYESDAKRSISFPPGDPPALYHAGCAEAMEGDFWEKQVVADVNRLRGCGYVVELKIIRPMR
jgi:hypothetical protein